LEVNVAQKKGNNKGKGGGEGTGFGEGGKKRKTGDNIRKKGAKKS